MATQPIDRKSAKHHFNVDKRKTPKLVNRTNKTILGEISPYEQAPRYWGWLRMYWRRGD